MSADIFSSVVMISGAKPVSEVFGTGFVIYRDGEVTCVVTCAKVIDDVGGPADLKVDGEAAMVAAIGSRDGSDLAVVRCASPLGKNPLPISATARIGTAFVAPGFHKYGKSLLITPVYGR